MLPLFKDKTLVTVAADGVNQGLFYNKFVDEWPDHAPLGDFTGLGGPEKNNWIKKIGAKAGDADQIKRAVDRIAALAGALSEHAPMRFQTTGPFVTGMGLAHPVENGFLWHHTLGAPYLPGSSVKGMIRAWAEVWLGDMENVDHLFGQDDKHKKGACAGHLIVFDALPTRPVVLMAEVITPHDGGWRIKDGVTPSDWISPTPIPFLVVAPGSEFQFAFAPRTGAGVEDMKTAYGYLEQALEWIGAGAKTAVGFGRFGDKDAIEKANEAAKEVKNKLKKEQKQAQNNVPPSVGDEARHEEWGCVKIKKINGDEAEVYSVDEAEYRALPLSELKKL